MNLDAGLHIFSNYILVTLLIIAMLVIKNPHDGIQKGWSSHNYIIYIIIYIHNIISYNIIIKFQMNTEKTNVFL